MEMGVARSEWVWLWGNCAVFLFNHPSISTESLVWLGHTLGAKRRVWEHCIPLPVLGTHSALEITTTLFAAISVQGKHC